MRNNTDIFVDYVFIDKITNTGHVLLYGKGVNNNIIAIVLTIIFLTSINIAYSVLLVFSLLNARALVYI